MQVYLLHVTVIWVVSALLYEALFIREASHRLNRLYLLGTLLLGLVSPLISLGNNPIPVAPIMNQPIIPATFMNYTYQSSDVITAAAQDRQIPWMLLIYAAGFAIMMSRLIANFFTLVRLYKRGTKHNIFGYHFIETGGAHGPFSFFRCIFISRVADFDEEDISLIGAHEMRHARNLHGLDILLTETLKIILWMHPLVYWYGSRLRRLHEYEADATAREAPGRYGKLLLNQMLFSEAPYISHSFYHSPIKLRLKMLMKSPGRAPFLKYAMVAPVLCAIMIGCMKDRPTASVALKNEKRMVFKGYELELGELSPMQIMARFHDTVHHPENHIGPYPVKLNGQKIYEEWEVTTHPVYHGIHQDASTYLFDQLRQLLDQLPDGTYMLPLRNVIVDEKGKLAYYQSEGLIPLPFNFEQLKPDTSQAPSFCVDGHPIIGNSCPDYDYPKIDSKLEKAIAREIIAVLQAGISFSPASIDGRPVPVYLSRDLHLEWYKQIEVKDHHAVLVAKH